jgi:biotin carboxylase
MSRDLGVQGTDDGVVLVIGCGMQKYREYLLSSAATRRRLWLFNAEEPTWQRQYVAGSTVMDLYDRPAVLAAAVELAGQTPIVGVLSWDETLIVTTAQVAEELGLPGATVDGVEGCRDKSRNRRLLTEAGLPQPGFAWVSAEDEAVREAARIGYPVVVKPRGMGASIGVVLARGEEDIRSAFHIAEDSSYDGAVAYHGGALVEEYVTGPEISVDAAVVDGEYLPMFLARKNVGMFPYFEELGHTVEAADPLLADETLISVLARAHRTIGYRYGITHTEVMMTERGPVVIEINGRLGGDLIPYLGKLATGVDPGVAVVDVATGNRPEVTATEDRTVGVRFGYPPFDCTVESVELPGPDVSAGLLEAHAIAGPGSTLRLPPGGYIARHSYVICTGPNPRACDALLDTASARVQLTCSPLPAEPTTGPAPELELVPAG